MNHRKSVLVSVCLAVFLTGCGSPSDSLKDGSDAPNSEAPVLASPVIFVSAETHAVIPGRVGADDWRSPIERFLQIPVDRSVLPELDHDIVEAGMVECMNERGFAYTPTPYPFDPEIDNDPNRDVYDAFSAEDQREYSQQRWGTFGDRSNSCETEANDRAHPINALWDEYSQLRTILINDERAVAAMAAIEECTGGNVERQAVCEADHGWERVVLELKEHYEPIFIEANLEQLTNLLNDRPEPVE